MTNVIPIHARQSGAGPLAYGPGVVPFDRSNPAHVAAWNAMFAIGLAEKRRQQEQPK